jgi:hypothetical protein
MCNKHTQLDQVTSKPRNKQYPTTIDKEYHFATHPPMVDLGRHSWILFNEVQEEAPSSQPSSFERELGPRQFHKSQNFGIKPDPSSPSIGKINSNLQNFNIVALTSQPTFQTSCVKAVRFVTKDAVHSPT